MKAELLAILACPYCRDGLCLGKEQLDCNKCAHSFALQNDIPNFLPEPAAIMPGEHQSNTIGPEFEEILRRGEGLTLHLGAGATSVRHPNCVEFEHKMFRHTDVVGDAHALPFRDEVFERVFAFNVFEHLREPARAAAEIRRVLKPGGELVVHTAFLQALHEAPHHYYNATEFGVREWFHDFEIDRCDVSGNFSPGFMLGFLAASVLHSLEESTLSAAEQAQVAGTTLLDWAQFWRRKCAAPPDFGALLTLPQELQKRIAAGFELRARKSKQSLTNTRDRKVD